MTDAKKLWETWGQASALYTAWAGERGINSYRLFVLYAIDGHDGITQKKIADLTGLSKQTVNTVVRALKSEGYLALEAGKGDRREKSAALTPEGQRYAGELLAPLYKLENDVVRLIGGARMQEMQDTIRLFTTVFEREMGRRSDE